ncbi:MAG: CsgG/HfaB family protein [Elusimicrobia bacterium]|nr:CsgG/HfaB family protein [Candidatus Obscuribacterium magneticum]
MVKRTFEPVRTASFSPCQRDACTVFTCRLPAGKGRNILSPLLHAVIVSIFLGFSLSLFAADSVRTLAQQLETGLKVKEGPLVAVLNFSYPRGRLSTGSYLVSERLVTYLVQDGVAVVERRLIQSLLDERKMWESGVIDPESVKMMSHVLGVDAIVIGTLSDASDEATDVVARVIRVPTGEILAAGRVRTERLWRDFPKLPRVAQGRAPLPASYGAVGFSQASSTRNEGRYKLSDLEAKPRRPVYLPAPVPFFIPASTRRFEGGSIQ